LRRSCPFWFGGYDCVFRREFRGSRAFDEGLFGGDDGTDGTVGEDCDGGDGRFEGRGDVSEGESGVTFVLDSGCVGSGSGRRLGWNWSRNLGGREVWWLVDVARSWRNATQGAAWDPGFVIL